MSDDLKPLLVSIERKLRRGTNPLQTAQRAIVKAICARLMAKPGNNFPPLQKGLVGHLLKVKASVSPAQTTVPTWAAELVGEEIVMSGLALLAPQSAYAQLSAAGLRVELPASGAAIKVPDARVDVEPVDPFVVEAGAIPARSRFLENNTLQPYKAALLSVVTGELVKRGMPSVEAIVGRLLSQDIMRGVDKRLLGTAAASPGHPPGILAGAVVVAPSASTDAQTAALADVSGLVAALADPLPAERPFLIMNAKQAATFALLFPGNGLPTITSEFIAAGTVAAVDAADFASASNPDSFDIDISKEALVHSETVPVDDIMSGHPVTSLWQVDCQGVRVIEDISWSMLSKAATVTGVKW